MNNTLMKPLWQLLIATVLSARLYAQIPNAQTIHETGQQYKEGRALESAGDNSAIGSEAMFQANLKAKKNIVDMKQNTFLSLWPCSSRNF